MDLRELEQQMRRSLTLVAAAVEHSDSGHPILSGSFVAHVTRLVGEPVSAVNHDGTVDAQLVIGPIDGPALQSVLSKIGNALKIPDRCRLRFALDAGRRTAVQGTWEPGEEDVAVEATRKAARSRSRRPGVYITLVLSAAARGPAPIRNLG